MKDYYAKWVHQIKTPIAGLQLLLQMERGEQENAESGERMTEEYHIKQLQNLTDMEENCFGLKNTWEWRYSINALTVIQMITF